MFRVRRFDYETVGAGRKPLQDVGRVKEDGDHDDREIRVLLLYAATEFVAINPRHQDVGQDDIRPRGLHLLYRLGTVARQYDIVASGIRIWRINSACVLLSSTTRTFIALRAVSFP